MTRWKNPYRQVGPRKRAHFLIRYLRTILPTAIMLYGDPSDECNYSLPTANGVARTRGHDLAGNAT